MFKILFALACLLAITHAGYPYAEQDHVINIGEPTWQTAINEFPGGIITYFYEPYCFPCRQFWPELHKTAQDLVDKQSIARIGKIECHDEIKLCNAQGVSTFPTILLHKGENHYEYRGPRVAEAFTDWVRKMVDFQYPQVDEEARLFTRASTVILAQDNAVKGVNEALMGIVDLVDVYVAGPTLKSKLNSNPAVILTQDGQVIPIASEDNGDAIRGKLNDLFFAQKTAVPNFTWEMSYQLKDEVDHDLIVFFRTKSFTGNSDAAVAFQKFAKEQGKDSKIIFAYVNVVNDLVGDTIAQLFGVGEDDEPTVGIISKKQKILQKYKLTTSATYDNIEKLYKDWQAGTASRYYMTAEVSEGQTGYVQELVGSNYDSVTGNADTNVLVMFYFPWCEECVKLDPTWKALAYRLRDHKDIVIAKIDLSSNDVKGQDISVFPTILFYGQGTNKEAVVYNSNRNIKSLKNFLFDHISGLKDNFEL